MTELNPTSDLMACPTVTAAAPSCDSAFTAEAPVCEGIFSPFDVTQAKIFLVDDEPINIKAAEKYLRRVGYQNLLHTTRSAEALQMIRQERPDLVLLDIMMPQVNGLDLLRQIRADAELQFMPVLILTAYCDADTKQEALEAGATDFLAKPVDPNELAPRVRNSLTVKYQQDRLAKRTEELECEAQRQAKKLAAALLEGELRYMSGKAEIATDVLHNVGNALNSINVGMGLLTLSFSSQQLVLLRRATALFEQHEGDVARFLKHDERGRVLPSYLVDLSKSLLEERETTLEELEIVNKHIQHINSIVLTQQKYAVACNICEEVQLVEVIEDVEELIGGSIARHGVELVREFADIPPLKTDRQRLLQVLLNVVKNAVQAVKQNHKTQMGRVEIRVGQRCEERAFVEISDNGVGIAEENMCRLFTYGFTTKPDGHGFGLHSCANIVKEMGGSINAQSDGEGMGSTFTLELPFESGDSK